MREEPPIADAGDLPQWSDADVAASFRTELHARFEAHNQAYRDRLTQALEHVP